MKVLRRCITAKEYRLLVHYSDTAEVRLMYGGGTAEVRWSSLSCTEKTLQCAGVEADMALH